MPGTRDLENPLAVALFLEVTESSGEHRGQGDYPDDLTPRSAGDHGHAGDPVFGHPVGHVAKSLVGVRGREVVAHDIADGFIASALRAHDRRAQQVASRHDPDKLLVDARDGIDPLALGDRRSSVPSRRNSASTSASRSRMS